MSATTPYESIRYPLESDFADVQDFYQLAIRVDQRIRDLDATFNAAVRPLAFLGHSSANSSGLGTGELTVNIDVVDWDPSGLLVGGDFAQPVYDVPSWWFIGLSVSFVTLSGTLTVGDHAEARIDTETTDPVSGLTSTGLLRRKTTETNSGGERLVVTGIVKLFQGLATPGIAYYGSTSGQKAAGAGAHFWAFRLGAAD